MEKGRCQTPAEYWIEMLHPWFQEFYPVLGLESGGRLLAHFQFCTGYISVCQHLLSRKMKSDHFSRRFREGIAFPNVVERSILKLPLSKLCAVPFALQNRAIFNEKGAKTCREKGEKRGASKESGTLGKSFLTPKPSFPDFGDFGPCRGRALSQCKIENRKCGQKGLLKGTQSRSTVGFQGISESRSESRSKVGFSDFFFQSQISF